MGFIKGLFDDSAKNVNPAHVVALSLTAAVIGWVTYLVIKTHALPDLQGPAFLLGGSGAMNIAHKAEDIIAKFRKQPESEVPPAPGA
jgi:hypothetical protein